MPYLTTRKKLKLQLSPGLVASYDIQPGNGVKKGPHLCWGRKVHPEIKLQNPGYAYAVHVHDVSENIMNPRPPWLYA